ncbi:MAG: protein kinase [Planctomycetota bacterium]|nr:protein kinase [Planctomycetota bacterium]
MKAALAGAWTSMPKESTYICPQCGSPMGGGDGSPQECPNCKTSAKAGLPAAKDAIPDTLLAPTTSLPQGERTATLLGTGRPKEPPAAPRASVPGYKVISELGRGGMGVVYKARHIGLNRVVALKMILSAEHAGREAVVRFKAEAEAVAQLKHPNIIQVYDIGEQDGRPFFSMEFVEGGSLQNRIRGQPQPPKWCAEVAEKLALAMHVAHSQGIVHRDLKPANVLLTAQGEPKIMDFGLAKRVESGEALTQSGAVMGTPQYMAPEQASGEARRVGPPADVYALGAILYTMLTGKPPFSAETAMATVQKVLHEEPAPPSRMTQRIPADLETICLKCLQKEPQKRYASAQELAADLRRFLDHEPILARRAGAIERSTKWARRRPAAAALIGVSAVAMVTLIGGGLWYNAQLRTERDRALISEKTAETATTNEKAEAQRARASEDDAKRRSVEVQRRLAESLVSQGDALCLAGRVSEAKRQYTEAQDLLAGLGDSTLLADIGLFEAYDRDPAVFNICIGHTDSVEGGVAFSPNGKLAVSGSYDKTVKLWDLGTGQAMRTFLGHTEGVRSVAFSPDGNRALSGSYDKTLKLWDVATGRELRTFSGHAGSVGSVALSPDGKVALSGSDDKTLILWDVETGHEIYMLSGHAKEVRAVAFTPDGKSVLSGSDDGTMKVWSVATGQEVLTFGGCGECGLPFSPDGKFALTRSGRKGTLLQLWDTATGQEVRTFEKGHTEPITAAALSPDNRLALSSEMLRKDLKLWDVATGRETRTFSGHDHYVWSIAFSPDGRMALSGSSDYTMRLWDVVAGREVRTFREHAATGLCVAFSPDSRLALSFCFGNTLALWDVATGLELRILSGHTEAVRSLAFSPNGRLALSGSDDKTLKLWDLSTGRELQTFSGHASPVLAVAFSPDGRFVLSGSSDKIILWSIKAGAQAQTFSFEIGGVNSVAFSPDGKLALSGSRDTTSTLWDVDTGRKVRIFVGHSNQVQCLAFSSDGKLALSGGYDYTPRVWDVASGRLMRTLRGHKAIVRSVAFSPDGALVVSVAVDNTIRLWDVATGREVRTLAGTTVQGTSAAFSPDGRLVLSDTGGSLSGSLSLRTLQLRDFSRPARYHKFDALLPKAREAIQKNENDVEALKTFGEWYAFRGVNDWAVEILEKARKNGAEVSPLTLARCYWLLSEDTTIAQPDRLRHRAAAAAEFQKEIARVKSQPVPQDAKAKLARAQEELHMSLCLQAVQRPAPEPAKPVNIR